jgi:hypothetical protein
VLRDIVARSSPGTPAAADDVLRPFRTEGFDRATVIGKVVAAPPRVDVSGGPAAPITPHRQAPVA